MQALAGCLMMLLGVAVILTGVWWFLGIQWLWAVLALGAGRVLISIGASIVDDA